MPWRPSSDVADQALSKGPRPGVTSCGRTWAGSWTTMEPIDFWGALRRSWRLFVVLALIGAVVAVLVPVSHTKRVKSAVPYLCLGDRRGAAARHRQPAPGRGLEPADQVLRVVLRHAAGHGQRGRSDRSLVRPGRLPDGVGGTRRRCHPARSDRTCEEGHAHRCRIDGARCHRRGRRRPGQYLRRPSGPGRRGRSQREFSGGRRRQRLHGAATRGGGRRRPGDQEGQPHCQSEGACARRTGHRRHRRRRTGAPAGAARQAPADRGEGGERVRIPGGGGDPPGRGGRKGSGSGTASHGRRRPGSGVPRGRGVPHAAHVAHVPEPGVPVGSRRLVRPGLRER